MTREEMKTNFEFMMTKVNGPTGYSTEKVLAQSFRRLAQCEPCDAEEAASYLAYDKELTYWDCCEMCS